jgi:small subunit ribosomal protein S13
MARISGVDIPREKRLEISLTYIFGVGRTTAQQLCDATGMSRDTRVRDLTDEEVARLRTYIDQRAREHGTTRDAAAPLSPSLRVAMGAPRGVRNCVTTSPFR